MTLRRIMSRTPAVAVALLLAVGLQLAGSLFTAPAAAQALPEIRMHERNRVPACATPGRLMQFLADRNPRVAPQFRSIAAYYKEHGERHRVRWDYAFFQMLLETNYLLFRNGSGQGDVNARQNNFAGIGTTGGGVPGDNFPDVTTGVLAQIQHLVAYSGEQVTNPVARRTREVQDDVIAKSRRLGRPVTFRDLAGRWAADRRYAQSITIVADLYRRKFCMGGPMPPEPEVVAPEVVANVRRDPARAGLGGQVEGQLVRPPTLISPPKLARRPACKVFTASYGGQKNVLIRRRVDGEVHYTALQVVEGRERGLAESFIRSHAQGGEAFAEYPTREAALMRAFDLCPTEG